LSLTDVENVFDRQNFNKPLAARTHTHTSRLTYVIKRTINSVIVTKSSKTLVL